MFWNQSKILCAFPQYNVTVAEQPGGDFDLIALHFHRSRSN